MIQFIKDWFRERRIRRLRLALLRAREGQRAAAWIAMQAEIKKRSPEQVRRLEEKMGLA